MSGTGASARRACAAGAGCGAALAAAAAGARGRGRNLTGTLAAQLGKARCVAQARAAGRGWKRTVAGLLARGPRPATPAPSSGRCTAGLGGEAFAEGAVEDPGAGEALGAKWRPPGTSTGAGDDPAFGRDGFPHACEPRRVRSSVRNYPAAAAPAARELARALERNPTAHTGDFPGAPIPEDAGHAAQRGARGDKAGRMQGGKRGRAPEAALGKGSCATNAAAVLGGARRPAPASVRPGIGPGTAELLQISVTGSLVGVGGRHDSAESVIGVRGP